jgi:hypothetical protein
VDPPIARPDAASGVEAQPRHPPLVPFALTVGVTGHRLEAIPAGRRAAVEARIAAVLEQIEAEAQALHRREQQLFAPGPPVFTLVSPLAEGSDQMAAEAALARGWQLQAVLPFDRSTYVADFNDEDSRARFHRLVDAASCTLELPGDPHDRLEAYVMAGRGTVAHCDILIAVWDGLPPRGRGGTGEIVELAIARGAAIVHLQLDASRPIEILWSAFDPNVVTWTGHDTNVHRPFDSEHLSLLLTAMLALPPGPRERHFYNQFCRERQRRVRARLEYPLLLALTGTARIRSNHWRESKLAAAIDDEWGNFLASCSDCHGVSASLELLHKAYGWADRMATYYAQTFRSGHIFNFVMAAGAVLLGLSSFALPASKLQLALAEMVITVAIIVNSVFGIRNEWHRRWLDYRQLAERLRPMRSLKLLGIAAPDPPGTSANPIAGRWIDWYAAGVWRALGCPHGRIDPANTPQLMDAIVEHELAPQIDYNERSAKQIEALDKRLARFGMGLFVATFISSMIVIFGLIYDPDWVENTNDWFTLLSAGFPAVGTAIFGIRFQGDFGASALRSRSTATTLAAIRDQLAVGKTNLNRSADLMEQATRAMLGDLEEWRLIIQQLDLSVG